MHIAVSASNRIEVLLETNGALAMRANTAVVAARRTGTDVTGRAATIASAVPAMKMRRFMRRGAPQELVVGSWELGESGRVCEHSSRRGTPNPNSVSEANILPTPRAQRASPVAFAPEQAGRTHHQHQDEDGEDQHVALRKHVRAAELIHEAEHQAADERARYAAAAAQHDHAEGQHVVGTDLAGGEPARRRQQGARSAG